MSLILEALRKSEAERRRGAAPDLLTPVAPARPAPPRVPPAAALWGGLAALALLVVGAALFWQPRSAPPAPAPVVAAEPARTASDRPVVPIREAAPPRSVPAPASAPAPAATPSASQATPAVEVPGAAPAPAMAPASATAATAAAAAAAPIADVPRALPEPPDTTTPASAPSTEFISPEATIRLAELSTEERSQLPALKVSMHMWAPERTQRFVIIDGTRLAEGDRVADATVSAINADGVTLAWRGRRIALPIR